MTILEKEQAHTPVSKEEEARAERAVNDVESDIMPPSYADSVPGPSSRHRRRRSSSCGRPAREAGSMPTNHVSISQRNEKIIGHWIIDTGLEVPTALLRPLKSGQQQRPNLSLETSNGTIKASVSLIAGTAQRAVIHLDTSNGKVEFSMPSRTNRQPFNLKGTTNNGEIRIVLPQDFIGPIKYRTRNGKIKFSDSLQRNTATFSSEVSFVGDWQAAGFQTFEKWEGDIVEVETSNGKVQFSFADGKNREERHSARRHEAPEAPSPGASDSGSRLRKGGGFWGRP